MESKSIKIICKFWHLTLGSALRGRDFRAGLFGGSPPLGLLARFSVLPELLPPAPLLAGPALPGLWDGGMLDFLLSSRGW